MKLGLFVRKECWALSFRGRIGVLALLLVFAGLIRWGAFSFLSVNKPTNGDLLVVEGWIPFYMMNQAAAEYHRGQYKKVVLVGSRLDLKSSCTTINSDEDYTAYTLMKQGVPRQSLDTLHCFVGEKDRTYQAALGVKEWLEKNDLHVKSFDVVTVGPHARRSWLTYRAAFGSSAEIGIVSLKDPTYDSDHWWRTTKGFRDVFWEGIAYVYAVLFFALH